MNSTRVRLMAQLLAAGKTGQEVTRFFAVLDEAKRLKRLGLEPCLGKLWAKAQVNETNNERTRT